MNTNHRAIYIVTLSLVALWLLGSIIVSWFGLFDQPNQPPTYFALFLAGPALGFILAFAVSQRFRAALMQVPLWLIVAIHSLRFVGFFFIADALTGSLPGPFAWPAGLGDIIAATLSIPLAYALYRHRGSKQLQTRFLTWNIFGLLDLFTAVTLGLLYSVSTLGILGDPTSNTRGLSFLPISLIPTFYVPILLLLHFLALRRLGETTTTMHKTP